MKNELNYYDNLVDEALRTGNYENIPGTDIIRVFLDQEDDELEEEEHTQAVVVPDNRNNVTRRRKRRMETASTTASRNPDRSIRIGSITELLPFSKNSEEVFDISMGIAGFLALRDFNQRQSVFLDDATLQKLQQCDFYMTMRMRDTAFKPSGAVRQFFEEFLALPDSDNDDSSSLELPELSNLNYTTNYSSANVTNDTFAYLPVGRNDNNVPLPQQKRHHPLQLRSFATLGPVLSDSSTAVANLAPVVASNPRDPTVGSQGIITLSPTSGSDALENPILYPYFARTISYSLGKTAALMAYMYKELNVRHLSILHAANDYGRAYLRNINTVAQHYGIQVYVTSYRDDHSEEVFHKSLDNAMNHLEEIPTVYHLGVFTGGQIQEPLLKLYDRGLIGPNQTTNGSTHQRVWFFSGTVRDAADIEADDDSSSNQRLNDLHRALHGSISVGDDDSQAELDMLKTLLLQFRQDEAAINYFLSRHVGDSIFANASNRYLWEEELHNEKYPTVSNARARSYDGVMALGLAACNAQHEDQLLTTANLHRGLRNVTFQGASGPVAFLETATRDPANMNYRLVNLLVDYDTETNRTKLSEVETIILSQHDGIKEVIRPIVLADGSTTLPPPLAPIHEDQGLVPDGLRIFCWSIASAVLLFSLLCATWTIYRGRRQSIKASQPSFLILFCFGTFLIGLSIIPWTWQEPMSKSVLDFGCMLHMWLIFVGFAITFGALFTRTRRISMIFHHADNFRRTQVQARDVMWMPIFLVTINVIILSLWTAMDPLRWERITISEDYFGRVTESHASCFHWERGVGTSLALMVLLSCINVAVILVTAVQSYRSRFLPSQYNERFHLAIASSIMLEAMLLGIPLLIVTGANASAEMVVGSWIYATCAFAVLLPMFVPKILVEEGYVEDRSSDEDFQVSIRQSLRKLRLSAQRETDQGSSAREENHSCGFSSHFLSKRGGIGAGVKEIPATPCHE